MDDFFKRGTGDLDKSTIRYSCLITTVIINVTTEAWGVKIWN